MEERETILDARQIGETLVRLAKEVEDRRGKADKLVLIGIHRRGADLAERLKKLLDKRLGKDLPLGKLDINLYRDDWSHLDIQPVISRTEIPFDIQGASVVLVDDVLYSGRTVRAALEAILDYGRPKRVELLVLIDRGHRELPIQADYVGRIIKTADSEHVNVLVKELDGRDKVCLVGA